MLCQRWRSCCHPRHRFERRKKKADADAEFLTKVVPSIAASVKIIEYAVKNASDEKVKEFAERVLKQHKESVNIASGHAKRLNIAVDTDADKDSKEMIDKLSKLKGYRARCRLSGVVEPHSSRHDGVR